MLFACFIIAVIITFILGYQTGRNVGLTIIVRLVRELHNRGISYQLITEALENCRESK